MNIDLKKYVIDNFKLRGLFLLFQILLTFILPLTLSPEKFGLLSLVFTNANFAVMLTSFGVPITLSYFIAKHPEQRGKLFTLLVLFSCLQLLLVAAIEIVSKLTSDSFLIWPTSIVVLGLMGIAWFFALTINEKLTSVFYALLKAEFYIKVASVFLLAQLALLFSHYYWGISSNENTVIFIIVSLTLVQGLFLLFWFYRSLNFKITDKWEWNHFRTYFQYALPAYIEQLLYFLSTKSDLWIINYFKSPDQVGYYAFAAKLGQLFLVIPFLIVSIVFPFLSSEKINEKIFERIIRLTNGVLLIGGIIAAICSFLIIPIFWKDKFNASILPFVCLIPGYIAQGQIIIYTGYFASKAKHKLNITVSIITLISLLLIDGILLRYFSIIAAAIGFSTASILGTIGIIYFFNKYTKTNSLRLIPNQEDLYFLIPAKNKEILTP